MNEKITFPRLATMLADRSGRSKRFSEDFLREFFALISERLEAGDSVKVKGLGTFRLSRVEPRRSIDVTTGQPMEISGHSKVVYIPSKELAEAINAPFEAFTAIEISDDADISQLFTQEEIDLQEKEGAEEDMATYQFERSADSTIKEEATVEDGPEHSALPDTPYKEERADKSSPATEMPKTKTASEDTPAEDDSASSGDDDGGAKKLEEEKTEEKSFEEEAPEDEAAEKEEEASDSEPQTDAEDISEEAADMPDEDLEPAPIRMKTWVKTLMISLGAAAFALLATFAIWYVFATHDFNGILGRKTAARTPTPSEGFVVGNTSGETNVSEPIPMTVEDSAYNDTIQPSDETEVPTAPSDPVVYDTISTTRYLTTMAKAHYGNYNLWPYIYEENKAILGHPDRIRPGTPVVIPKLSKYGVDPSNSADVEKAKKIGVEIYARYGKKI